MEKEQIHSEAQTIDKGGVTTADVLKVASIAGDLAGVVAGFVPGGSVVAATTGVASTLALFGADVSEDGFQGRDLANAGLGLGLDALSALPLLGEAAKMEKVAKVMTHVAPWILKTFGAVMGTIGVSSAIPVLLKASKGEHLSIDDYRSITNAIQGIAGFYHMGKGHIENKKINQERVDKLGTRLANDNRYTVDPDNKIGLVYDDPDLILTPTTKKWKNGLGVNNAMEVRLKSKPDLVFEIVLDTGIDGTINGEYSLHFKTDQGALTSEEIDHLSSAIYNMLPDGAKILTHGEVTPGAGSMFSNRLRAAGFLPHADTFEVTEKNPWTKELLSKYDVFKTEDGKLRMLKLIKSGDLLVCKFGCKAPIIDLRDKEILRQLLPGELSPKQYARINPKDLKYVNAKVRYDTSRYNLNYTGKTHAISEIVDTEGNINVPALRSVLIEIENGLEGTHNLEGIISKNKRHIEAGVNNTLEHVLAVASSALKFPIPYGATKLEYVFGALMHDVGKMIDVHPDRHGILGAELIRKIFPETSLNLYDGIRYHMKSRKPINALQAAISSADIDNGTSQNYEEFLEKFGTRVGVYGSTERFPAHMKGLFGSDLQEKHIAEKLKLTPGLNYSDIELIKEIGKHGLYRLKTDSTGKVLLSYKGNEYTVPELRLLLRKELETEGKLDLIRTAKTSIPNYNDTRLVKKINPETGEVIKVPSRDVLIEDAIDLATDNGELAKLKKAALEDKESDAIHVYANIKYLKNHSLTGLTILGGRTKGKHETRLTLGLLSDIVDVYKEGYRGIVAPVLKGNGNFIGRNELGFNPIEDFGSYLYTSNSPLVAMRYADLRKLDNYTEFELLLENLPENKKLKVIETRNEILSLLESMGEKLGNREKTVTGKNYRSGTYENFSPSFYNRANKENRKKLMSLFDDLQHLLGNKNLAVGGTRRGILLINDDAVVTNYEKKSYRGHLPQTHALKGLINGNHNRYALSLSWIKIPLAITTNIGETTKAALNAGAPYEIDFMTYPNKFIISRWNLGGKLNNINYFNYINS